MEWSEIWSVVKDIPGYYEENELFFLSETARNHQYVIEVGCERGRSSVAIGLSMPEGGSLTIVDNFETYPEGEVRREFFKHIKKVPVIWGLWEGDSRKLNPSIFSAPSSLSKTFPGRATMAHVDGGHDFEVVLNDLNLFVNTDVILVHDYDRDSLPGVKRAVDKFIRDNNRVGGRLVGSLLEITQ